MFLAKRALLLTVALFLTSSAFAQTAPSAKGRGFFDNLNQRVYLGSYSSYFSDNIRLMQVGYDLVLPFIMLSPSYNLLDFGIGADALMAFDDRGGVSGGRPVNARMTPGLELNWSLRIYVIPLRSIQSRIFLEGQGDNLVVYSRKYPDAGTNLNIGSNASIGLEFPVSGMKAFCLLRLFHTSNGRKYENNPALNAVGMVAGFQFG
jgi:hypothetical protein